MVSFSNSLLIDCSPIIAVILPIRSTRRTVIASSLVRDRYLPIKCWLRKAVFGRYRRLIDSIG
jgi:hypothetical protein